VFASLGGAFLGDKYQDALFENPGHGASWIGIRLVGRKASRAVIGARLRAVLQEGGRETQRTRFVGSGGSFGASPFAQHIGLGRGARLERVEIDWPGSPTPQVLTGVPLDTWIEVVEGDRHFKRLDRARFKFGSQPASGRRATSGR
jgi:hypothetical protein